MPDDPTQVVYVWFDALINYISATGWPDEGELYQRLWPADIHFMAKDIFVRFHSTLWPCMLMALGVPLPRRIIAHGFWTVEGEKMSKSRGNAYQPMDVANALASASGCQVDVAVDALRYYLMREVPFGQDGDFSSAGLVSRFNSDLANDLGNLLNRALALADRYSQRTVPQPIGQTPLADAAKEAASAVEEALNSLAYSAALQAVWSLLSAANRYFNDQAPWRLYNEGHVEEAGSAVYAALESVRIAAALLWPFMPYVAGEIYKQLGITHAPNAQNWDQAVEWGGLRPGTVAQPSAPIFPRIEAKTLPLGLNRVREGDKKEKDTEANLISIEEFQKLDLRTARIQQAERVPGATKLLKLVVDIGQETRTVVAGIAEYYQPEELMGKTVVLVCNLTPTKIRGITSEGMILAAVEDNKVVLITTDDAVPPGTKVR